MRADALIFTVHKLLCNLFLWARWDSKSSPEVNGICLKGPQGIGSQRATQGEKKSTFLPGGIIFASPTG